MRVHGRLAEDPIFLPAYSNAFYRGMLVTITLRLKGFKRLTGNNVTGATVRDALARHFAGKKYVKVEVLQEKLEPGYVLSPLDMNDTNHLQLRAIYSPEREVIVLAACLDNLGKGAAGAAVQNMDLMLGLGG
jgi:N-acetyl-gamma-glutamyl-phosphate reductase